MTEHLKRFADLAANQEPIIFLSFIDDETGEEVDICSMEKAFATLQCWRLDDLQRIAALEKTVASLERASYRMATDMNGGA